jgi:hypothetical protein
MTAIVGSTTPYVPQDSHVIKEAAKQPTLVRHNRTAEGKVVCTMSATINPKQLSDARISQLFARRAEAEKNIGGNAGPLAVPFAMFGLLTLNPWFIIPTAFFAIGGLLDDRDPEKVQEQCKLKRSLELEIDAEQAFADNHPQELGNNKRRKIFVAEHMKAHENDPEYESCGYEADSYNVFEERQRARKGVRTIDY